jgi:hypothetical protein
VLGFAKRLATLCLQLLHNGAIAGLALLRQLLVTHTAAEQLLDSEHEVRCGCFLTGSVAFPTRQLSKSRRKRLLHRKFIFLLRIKDSF